MKKIVLTIFTLLITLVAWSQIVTSNPAFVTNDYNGVVEITYDASLGNQALKDYTGTDVYAHTGVITNQSTSGSDWKHAPVWLDNSSKYLLTKLGNNKWQLSITPNMASYYGLNTGEIVKKLAFVFRNSDGSKQGKDVGDKDIFLDVYNSGLNVTLTSSINRPGVAVGSTVDFTVNASDTADISLSVNQNKVKSVTSSTSLNYSYTFNSTGDYTLIAAATANSLTVYDTLNICVPEPVTTDSIPHGIQDGINYVNDSTVTLVLHAPNKNHVFLIGEFNNWIELNKYQLKKDGEYWWITLSGLTPGKIYAYQYLVDDTIRISDPYTQMVLDPWNDQWINSDTIRYPNLKPYPTGKTEGLVATFQTDRPTYNWQDTSFTMKNKDNLVIYELLLRDFTKEKTVEAAISKLDYLKKLGITAVELMPITEFDGNDSWGYNPNHYFAPDKFYGPENEYKKFIDECHKRGIGVILDMVFNHATGLNPMAMLYWDAVNNRPAADNPWFNVVAPHPYSVFNDFNHSYWGTRDYFKRVLKFWINEYHIDGYRMDLSKGFTQTQSTVSTVSNYDQSRIDILTDYYDAAKSAKSDIMFILEHFAANSEESVLANEGMYLWRNCNYAYSQAAMGYQSGSDFSGMISTPRQWVGYAESHDEERTFYKAKAYGDGTIKTDSLVRIARVPLVMAFDVLLPGPKMLWEFEELGYDYPKSFNGDMGVKPVAWSWLNLPERKAVFDDVSKIISLRKMYPDVFSNGTYQYNVSESDWDEGRRISITSSTLDLVILGNFKSTSILAYPDFPKTGTWYNVLTGAQTNVTNTNLPISMSAGQLLIYADKAVNFTDAVNTPKANNNLVVFPTITHSNVYVLSDNNVNNISVYNIQGTLLKNTAHQNEINLSNYSNGVYILKINTDLGTKVFKVLKN